MSEAHQDVAGTVEAAINDATGVVEEVEAIIPEPYKTKLANALKAVDGIVKFIDTHQKEIDVLAGIGEQLAAGKPISLMSVLPSLLGVVL